MFGILDFADAEFETLVLLLEQSRVGELRL